jgi:hypothetical protein
MKDCLIMCSLTFVTRDGISANYQQAITLNPNPPNIEGDDVQAY